LTKNDVIFLVVTPMRKEVILAIIIGIILGAIVLYGLKIANQTVVSQKPEATTITPTLTLTPTPTPVDTITIDFPIDHSVSSTAAATLSGHTKPLVPIAIITETTDTITQSDNAGNFSLPITLVGGENVLTASIVLQDGSTSSKSITVIYTTTVIDN
jgi:hypothetical protein